MVQPKPEDINVVRNSNSNNYDYMAVIARRRRLFTFIAAPIVAVCIGLVLGLPSLYESEVLVRIDSPGNIAESDVRSVSMGEYADQYVNAMRVRVMRHDNLAGLVDSLDLYPADRGASRFGIDEAVDQLRDDIVTEIIATPVIDPNRGREMEIVTAFRVLYRNPSAESAQNGAQALAESYLSESRSARGEAAQSAIELFKQEADKYLAIINRYESRLATLKENNQGSMPEQYDANLRAMDRTQSDLDSLQLDIANARTNRMMLQAQFNQLASGLPGSSDELAELRKEFARISSIYAPDHPDVVNLRRQIMGLSGSAADQFGVGALQSDLRELQRQLDQMLERYWTSHPDVIRLQATIAQLQEQIKNNEETEGSEPLSGPDISGNTALAQTQIQLEAVNRQLQALTERESSLREKLARYERSLNEAPQVEIEYQEIIRELSNAREKYRENQDRQADAEITLALETGEYGRHLTIIQPADLPADPSFPPRAAILILGTLLAAGIGIGTGVVVELMDPTVRGSGDVEELFQTPPIAVVPTVRNSVYARKRAIFLGQNVGLVVGCSAIVISLNLVLA